MRPSYVTHSLLDNPLTCLPPYLLSASNYALQPRQQARQPGLLPGCRFQVPKQSRLRSSASCLFPLHLRLLTRGLLLPFLQMLALIAYLGIFLFGCELRDPSLFPLRSSLSFNPRFQTTPESLEELPPSPSFERISDISAPIRRPLRTTPPTSSVRRSACDLPTRDRFTDYSLRAPLPALLQVGAFFGALGAAPLVSRLGRKMGLFVGCFIFLAGGVCSTCAMHDLGPMIAGRYVPWSAVPSPCQLSL